MFRLAPLFLVAALAVAGCSSSSAGSAGCAKRFDSAAWKSAERDGSYAGRPKLARAVVRCRYVKVGDSRRDVERVLGKPPREDVDGFEWRYYLGITGDDYGPGDGQFLIVVFGGNHVSEVFVDPDKAQAD